MATYFMLSSGSRTSFDAELKSSYLYMLRPGESEVRVHGTDASGKICQAKDRTTEPVIFVPVAGQKFKVLCSDVQLPEPPAATDARFQELPVVKPVGRSQRLIYEPYDWPSEWQSKVTNVRVIEAENGRPPSLMAHGGDQRDYALTAVKLYFWEKQCMEYYAAFNAALFSGMKSAVAFATAGIGNLAEEAGESLVRQVGWACAKEVTKEVISGIVRGDLSGAAVAKAFVGAFIGAIVEEWQLVPGTGSELLDAVCKRGEDAAKEAFGEVSGDITQGLVQRACDGQHRFKVMKLEEQGSTYGMALIDRYWGQLTAVFHVGRTSRYPSSVVVGTARIPTTISQTCSGLTLSVKMVPVAS